ncbi:hypothetical protein EDD85DRAFT_935598 [Armillaria nabsnona]|nr:hypothetical protein EDD85DRAFT_935598 [Armillaria nabsnona]
MTSAYTAVYSIPLGSLQGACVDVTSCGDNTYKGASPCKYRLIDCVQYVCHNALVIHEFDELPTESYSAASYIWRGKPFDPSFPEQRGFFSVLGAENGDPISMDVLYHVCMASLQKKAKLIWLDRLCIIQQSRDNKAWQIQRMYGIYKACDPWRRGSGFFIGPTPFTGDLEEVVTGESALANIMDLLLPYLGGIMGGQTFFHLDEDREPQDKEEESGIEIKPILFGRIPSHALALLGALWPSVRDPDAIPHAVWRSALMHMVFSIMGIFDVTLNPKAFRSHDRLGATIALAQEILRKGGNASWLIATMNLPPERQLSSFPAFPTTRVDGKAQIEVDGVTQDLAEVVVGDEFLERWSLKESPKGSMDDDGYLTISSQAIVGKVTEKGRDVSAIPSVESSLLLLTALPGKSALKIRTVKESWCSLRVREPLWCMSGWRLRTHTQASQPYNDTFRHTPCWRYWCKNTLLVIKSWHVREFDIGPNMTPTQS